MLFKDSPIRRIRIIGGAGSGKTTLGKKLSDLIGFQLISLDHYAKKIKGMHIEASEVFMESFITQTSWIIEGVQDEGVFSRTIDSADVIIFLDYELSQRRRLLIKRYLGIKSNRLETRRKCSLKQLIHLMKWNRQFDAKKTDLVTKLEQTNKLIIHIKSQQELKENLEAIETHMIRKGEEEMDLSKLNFFNKKVGEKYKYEYNYDEDYEYDYDYEYEYDIIPSQTFAKEEPSIPEVEKTIYKKEETVLEKNTTNLKEENETLKQEIAEQNEYIKKLMLIKQKSDEALTQLRDSNDSLKEMAAQLKEQLIQSETQNEELATQLASAKESTNQIVTETVTETSIPEVKEESRNLEAEVLAKHIKLTQVTTQKMEQRLSEVESELEKVKAFSLNNVKRKKSTKKQVG